jgi:hypothetical protein
VSNSTSSADQILITPFPRRDDQRNHVIKKVFGVGQAFLISEDSTI